MKYYDYRYRYVVRYYNTDIVCAKSFFRRNRNTRAGMGNDAKPERYCRHEKVPVE